MSAILSNILKFVLSIFVLFLFQNQISLVFNLVGIGISYFQFPFEVFGYNVVQLQSWVLPLWYALPLVFLMKFIFTHIIHKQSG